MIWFWGKFGIDIFLTKSKWFQWIFWVFDKFEGFLFFEVFFFLFRTNTISSSTTMMNIDTFPAIISFRAITSASRLNCYYVLWFSWLLLSSFTRKSFCALSWIGLIFRRCVEKCNFFRLSFLSCIEFRIRRYIQKFKFNIYIIIKRDVFQIDVTWHE